MNKLIERLKAQDANEARLLRRARPLWIMAAAIFSLIFLAVLCFPPAGIQPIRVWLTGVLAAVYVLDALLLAWRVHSLGRIDYTESVRSFLEKAEARFQFMLPQDRWLAAVGLPILGTVGGFYVGETLFPRYISPGREPLFILFYCLGYALVCIAGFGFTYKNWKTSKAPLLSEIRKLKQELAAD